MYYYLFNQTLRVMELLQNAGDNGADIAIQLIQNAHEECEEIFMAGGENRHS